MILERADTADCEVMATIHAACFPTAEAWSSNVFRLQLALPGVYGLLHPDGGLILLRVTADEAEVLTLAVNPVVQRTGIGTALLQGAIEIATSAHAHALFLEVSVSNRAALTLYKRAGFNKVGFRPRYYADRSDALVLRRDLAKPLLSSH